MRKLLIFILLLFGCNSSRGLDERLLAVKVELLAATYQVDSEYLKFDAKVVIDEGEDYFYFLKLYEPVEELKECRMMVIFSIDQENDYNIADYPSIGIIDAPITLTNVNVDNLNDRYNGISLKIVSTHYSPYFLIYLDFVTNIKITQYYKISITPVAKELT